MSWPCLQRRPDGVEVRVFVQPRASRNQVIGLLGDELKVSLTAPPVDGAANKACTLFLAKTTGLPRRSVRILSGESSRHKRFLLEDAVLEDVVETLERAGS